MTPRQRAWAFQQVRQDVGLVCPQALRWVGYPEPNESWHSYRLRSIADATLACATDFWNAGKGEQALETLRIGLALMRSNGAAEMPDE